MQAPRGPRSFYVDRCGRPRAYVSNPDWHSQSWLNYDEVLAALAYHQLEVTERSPEFRAMLAALAELTRHFGTDKVRLVFWFDG
jgi:hypothetical protein